MVSFDPKWLEILKASGWQTTAITVSCCVFLYLSHTGILPTLPDWAVLLVAFTALMCGCLAVASWGSAAYKFFPLHKWFLHRLNIHRTKSGLSKYIPFMTPIEKKIIAYLLAKNMKTFTADADGGHAATLLSRGIITVLARNGQHLQMDDVPMTVPDPVWDVLSQHKDQFPYTPPSNSREEPYPWRVHWMER